MRLLRSTQMLRAILILSVSPLALLSVLLPKPMASATPGVKIVARNSSAARGETITYLQSDRKRVEERRQVPQLLSRSNPSAGRPFIYVPAPPIVTITRCDLNEMYVLNLADREYTSMPLPKPPSKEELEARAAQLAKSAARSQPTLLIETATKDTGERRQMFGYMARHVMTTVRQIPLVESSQIPQETVTDGWYIDLDTSISCVKSSSGYFGLLVGGTAPHRPGEPPQMPVLSFKEIGKRVTGLALATKEVRRATLLLPDGSTKTSETNQSEIEVTELNTGPLDAALFEVPKNFRKVDRVRRAPTISYWRQLLGWLGYYWSRLIRAI